MRLAKWLLNFLLGYVGDLVGWVEGKIAEKQVREEEREAGRVEGAGKAVAETLQDECERIAKDKHVPTEQEMNDLFAPRGGKP